MKGKLPAQTAQAGAGKSQSVRKKPPSSVIAMGGTSQRLAPKEVKKGPAAGHTANASPSTRYTSQSPPLYDLTLLSSSESSDDESDCSGNDAVLLPQTIPRTPEKHDRSSKVGSSSTRISRDNNSACHTRNSNGLDNAIMDNATPTSGIIHHPRTPISQRKWSALDTAHFGSVDSPGSERSERSQGSLSHQKPNPPGPNGRTVDENISAKPRNQTLDKPNTHSERGNIQEQMAPTQEAWEGMLLRSRQSPPSYTTYKAMRPTLERLRENLEKGKQPIGRVHQLPKYGVKAVEAELEHRGLRSSTQKDMFFSELGREYSRILAGTSQCLLSTWKRMLADLYEECREIRRDLAPQPKNEGTTAMSPIEALMAYGQGCTDESSICASESDSEEDSDEGVGCMNSLGSPTPCKGRADLVGFTSTSRASQGMGADGPSQPRPAGKDDLSESFISSPGQIEQPSKGLPGGDKGRELGVRRRQRRLEALSRIVQGSLGRRISAEDARTMRKDVRKMAKVRNLIAFYAGGWKRRVVKSTRPGTWVATVRDLSRIWGKGRGRIESERQCRKIVSEMLG